LMLQRQRNDRARPATFADHAFNLLHADIVRAKLRPGEKMRVERLRKAYGVGAKPLSEALSKLSSLDLVTAEGRGFRVAPVSVANLLDITKTCARIESLALRAAIASENRRWRRTFWRPPTGCAAVLRATAIA
jgi:GntR family transcriptional regulator, carbon starvation induced regulator